MDDNGGYYFTPTITPGAPLPSSVTPPNTFTLQLGNSGSYEGTFGTVATVSATLGPHEQSRRERFG